MTFVFQSHTYTIPDNLAGISVAQQMSWSDVYGYDLVQRGRGIVLADDTPARELTRQVLLMDELTMSLSFYSGIDLATLQANMDLDDVFNLTTSSQIVWAIQSDALPMQPHLIPLPDAITTGGDTFKIFSPLASVTAGDMSFEQYAASLLAARYLLALYNGDWSTFPALCAAYVRHEGEAMTRALMDPSGARFATFRAMDMAQGMALAQYFLAETGELISVINAYTNASLASPAS